MRTMAQVHAPRLKVMAVRNGGDLSISLLAGIPYLHVIAFARREACVPTAQQYLAKGQLERLQQTLDVLHHGLMLHVRGLCGADFD